MELFEQIRREYDHGVGTIKGVARKLGIHRRMVREALGMRFRESERSTRGASQGLEPVKAFIEAMLQGGREGAAKATTHGASDLVADPRGAGGGERWPSLRFVVMFASGRSS